MIYDLVCAGLNDANAAFAFVYRPLICEEFERVVEDFYGVGGAVKNLLRGLVEAIGLQGLILFKHKIPVNPLTADACRVLLDNESFIFPAHCAFTCFCIFDWGRAKIIAAEALMHYNIPKRIRISQGSWLGNDPAQAEKSLMQR